MGKLWLSMEALDELYDFIPWAAGGRSGGMSMTAGRREEGEMGAERRGDRTVRSAADRSGRNGQAKRSPSNGLGRVRSGCPCELYETIARPVDWLAASIPPAFVTSLKPASAIKEAAVPARTPERQ